MRVVSSGKLSPTLYRRTPASASIAGVISSRRSTSIRSKWALPQVTMPTLACGDSITWRSMLLMAENARTASSLSASRDSMRSEGRSGQR